MVRLSIGDLTYKEVFELGCREDVLSTLVPSDIRALATVLKEQQMRIKKLEERGSVRFILDGEHKTARYSIEDLLLYDKEGIIENEEECDCSLNESVNCCEGDCMKFENSEITGYEFV